MTSVSTGRSPAPVAGTLGFVLIRVLGLATGTVTSLVLLRLISIEEFGSYSAATGALILVAAFGYLGTDQLLFASRLSSREFEELLPLLSGGVLVVTGILMLAWPVPGPGGPLVILAMGLTRCLEILRGSWILRPQLDGRHILRATREFALQLALGAGTIVGVGLSSTALGAASGAFAASVIVSGLLLSRSAFGRLTMRVSRRHLRSIRDGLAFALSSILYSVTHSMGLALMSLLAAATEIAVYRAAMLVYVAALVIPIAVNNDVLRPHLMRQIVAEPGAAPRLLNRILVLNVGLSLVAGLALVAFGRFLVEPVFGAGYSDVEELLAPLAAALPFAFVSSYVANLLVALGDIRSVVYVQLVLVLLALLVTCLLILLAGALGAAFALLVVDVAAVLIYLLRWRRFRRKDER
jgi:O-antigen/teichoic acid export membrane protein